MEIIEITNKEYKNIFTNTYHIFNSIEFNELNKNKCQKIRYLIFKDNKIRLGIIFGEKENSLYSPFSAPFGGFSFIDNEIQIKKIEESIYELDKYCQKNKIEEIKITLPPLIYDEKFLSKLILSLQNNNYKNNFIDLNYNFLLKNFNNEYLTKNIWRNARKNFNIASKNNFIIKKTQNQNDFKKAYKIIEQNRKERGFPLKMSFDQVFETSKIILCDSFILYLNKTEVASAIIFHTSKNIVQVIYWGDIPKYSHQKTMNYLSYKIFEYYKNKNIEVIDIGPSTENGIPNYGLCEFKESIGCNISLKYTFTKKII